MPGDFIHAWMPGDWWLVTGEADNEWLVTGDRWLVDRLILDTKASIRIHLDGSYPGSIAIWGGAPISKELSYNP